jgi:hypothetical protein
MTATVIASTMVAAAYEPAVPILRHHRFSRSAREQVGSAAYPVEWYR